MTYYQRRWQSYQSSRRRFAFWFCLAALLSLLLLVVSGRTPLWSQSSEPQSSSFNLNSQMLDELQEKVQTALSEQRNELQAASEEISRLRVSSTLLSTSLENVLKKSTDLEDSNLQLAESLKTRNEELAAEKQARQKAESKAQLAESKSSKFFWWAFSLSLLVVLYIACRICKLIPQTSAFFKWVV